ncbi:WD domain, G-beta repeat containing protein [Entamoeba histolytica HM-1:IMSS-B]|uniref:WD domain containing protein n=6 Tax=Entamoeba histolytica TaxID=5759 RepID=C4LV49_ENTH1|nr:WD domain containing protein [Entamoeba histolytica HM-1:IMSS]EMD45052.1 WD domain containing protein [Entamoeba histolytica KU27]EMH72311.1 WD domain, G-beta repeat containing protein [Entamoeba histolytica HM-1:IMSS-B]EMS10735.1 mitogen-activated protein kinase organizer, putative [Entamoeba histolytica HM-3:IMSS]ENY63612.1 mitogen-activated protein kinase organizer, putative [Entamoeba histolytica HM-1:IMSS-A]GAT92530.1 WD domain containing protein [Entamoeba histolytica]|eukprot:XP_649107.1 WD domain containing protein [Entamoeba histolytica HM-1:IMSS]
MKKTSEFKQYNGGIFVTQFTLNGKYIVSGGDKRVIRLHNTESKKLIKTYSSPCKEVLDIKITRDNGTIICCGNDTNVYSIDVVTSSVLRKYGKHEAKINCIEFNNQYNVIASGSFDMKVKLWDLGSKSNTPLMSLNQAKDSITSIKIEDTQLFTTSMDGFIRVYDLRKGLVVSDDIKKPLTSLSIINSTTVALSSIEDSSINIYNRKDMKIIHTYNTHLNKRIRINNEISLDKKIVFTGDETGKIYQYNFINQNQSYIEVSKSIIGCISMNPTKQQIVYGSFDGKMGLLDY